MGLAVEYEVGNVFDPAYTMVCKMRKSLLQQVTGREGDWLPAKKVGVP